VVLTRAGSRSAKALALLLWAAALPGYAQPPAKPLSERVVSYQIDAQVDAVHKSIDATETLTWRNLTGKPQDTFPFHLYLDAFQPKSTFVQEGHRDYRDEEWRPEYAASATVRSLEVAGMGDLTSQIKFISPDDGNPDDRTVFQIKLPRAIPAGGSVQFRIVFHDQLGEVLARSGYKRDFIMGAQWFPKIGVWWQGAWNCHQYHAATEFFADFGNYDVRLTLPQNEVVGASGVEVSNTSNSDGTKTLVFHGEDIHDFAWTAQPEYHVVSDAYTGSQGTVRIRMLMQPANMASAPRYMGALKGAMKLFEKWYGPYPYPQITVVDPPNGALEAAGMEYPMLITAGTAWWFPRGVLLPEDVVVHEFGHQYWYGMVATNEVENAWMDEGVNTYSEFKAMNSLYGEDTSYMNFWGITSGIEQDAHRHFAGAADRDPISRFAYQYMNSNTYGAITYEKTGMFLLTLEGIIGEAAVQNGLRNYFQRYRFTHPTQEDLLKTFEEISGQNLRWYFDQAVYGSQVLDYEVLQAYSEATDWENADAAKKQAGDYHTEVLLHRKGDFIFPVNVTVRFDNGEAVHEHWDGRDRWVRFTYRKKARLGAVRIDPEGAVWLDRDFYNNSHTREPLEGAKRKVAAYWVIVTQLFSQALAWLA
jgi:hypothetical protein